VHPSDAAATLVALDASVRLRGPSSERTVSVEQLYAQPTSERRTETTIQPDELLLEISLPARAPGTRSVYRKAMEREVWAFALVGVAVAVKMESSTIQHARVVLSGVAPVPWRARAAEAVLTGERPSDDLFAQAGEAAVREAQPLEHNAYKVTLARNLIAQALAEAAR
jgi:xanthine dehydrogenase YagS FAD-binding subunit